MDCEVAREALSARIDGEREPVPAERVDEHLGQCADCRDWFDRADVHATALRRLATQPVSVPAVPRGSARRLLPSGVPWPRWALGAVGAVQLALALAQAFGMHTGMSGMAGMPPGGHLLNESTAWSIALGAAMIGAGLWPTAAAGLAAVLTSFAAVLAGYVVADALSGAVTLARVLGHLPVVAGALLAILVWRRATDTRPTPHAAAWESDIDLPHNASRGRRRGHLWSTDGAA